METNRIYPNQVIWVDPQPLAELFNDFVDRTLLSCQYSTKGNEQESDMCLINDPNLKVWKEILPKSSNSGEPGG